jgi:hypothetical protein
MQIDEYEFEDDFGNTITVEEQPNQMGGINYVIVTDDDDIGIALYSSMELFFKENGFRKTRDTTED